MDLPLLEYVFVFFFPLYNLSKELNLGKNGFFFFFFANFNVRKLNYGNMKGKAKRWGHLCQQWELTKSTNVVVCCLACALICQPFPQQPIELSTMPNSPLNFIPILVIFFFILFLHLLN